MFAGAASEAGFYTELGWVSAPEPVPLIPFRKIRVE